MGLLDGLLGEVLGGTARGRGMPRFPGGSPRGAGGAAIGALVMLALQMLQRNGGLEGVLGRMQRQGHAREADSWVGTGPNMPVSPDVLSQIFGHEALGRAAEQAGISPDDAAGGLATVFPEVINEMTPQGRVEPGSDDVVSRALEILERRQRGA